MKIPVFVVLLSIQAFAINAFADEAATCAWLHLDGDVRVYQCSVLPEEVTPTLASGEQLPDPTLPLSEQVSPQKTLQVDSAARFSQGVTKHVVAREVVAHDIPSSDSPEKFMVLATGDIEKTRSILQVWDDTHFYLLKNANRLSLGVFSSVEAAQRRQQALSAKGVQTELSDMSDNSIVVQNNVEDRFQKTSLGKTTPDKTTFDKTNGDQTSAEKVTAQKTNKPNTHALKVGAAPAKGTNIVMAHASSSKAKKVYNDSKEGQRSGYLVVSLGEASKVINKVERLEVSDYLLLTVAPYENRVSFGVYSGFKSALTRQLGLKKLGLDSEMISRRDSIVVRSTIQSMEQPESHAVKHYPADQLVQISTEI